MTPPVDARADRHLWLDTFRGLAIILVVLGHVAGGVNATPYLSGQPGLRGVYDWIYAFHMPAFFWAAGLVMARSLQARGPGGFVLEKARTLLYPYLVWGLIGQLAAWLARGYVNSPYDPWRLVRMLYDPAAGLWFLATLFLLSAAYAALWRAPARDAVFLAAAVAGHALYQSVAELPPGAYQVCRYGVYLAAGVVAGPRAIAWAGRGSVAGLAAAGLLGFAGLTAAQAGLSPHRLAELPKALLGIGGLFGLAASAARVGPAWVARPLDACGRASMEIYLAHPFTSVPLRIALYRGLGVTDPLVHVVAATAGGVLGPLLFARSRRLRYLVRI